MDLYELLLKINMEEERIGGGAASALMGSIAANMAAMVARISIGKNFGLSDEEYEEIIRKAGVLAEELKKGAVEDHNSYAGIVAAYRLPKGSEQEKAERRRKIDDAAYKASVVPLENGKGCMAVKELCSRLMERSNPSAFSDLYCALEMSALGVKGCILNVKANLPTIKDAERVSALQEGLKILK